MWDRFDMVETAMTLEIMDLRDRNAKLVAALEKTNIIAMIQLTLIGFEEELTQRDRDFIADQIARKVEALAQQSTEKP